MDYSIPQNWMDTNLTYPRFGSAGLTNQRNNIHLNPNFKRILQNTNAEVPNRERNSVHINPRFLQNNMLSHELIGQGQYVNTTGPTQTSSKIVHVNPKMVTSFNNRSEINHQGKERYREHRDQLKTLHESRSYRQDLNRKEGSRYKLEAQGKASMYSWSNSNKGNSRSNHGVNVTTTNSFINKGPHTIYRSVPSVIVKVEPSNSKINNSKKTHDLKVIEKNHIKKYKVINNKSLIQQTRSKAIKSPTMKVAKVTSPIFTSNTKVGVDEKKSYKWVKENPKHLKRLSVDSMTKTRRKNKYVKKLNYSTPQIKTNKCFVSKIAASVRAKYKFVKKTTSSTKQSAILSRYKVDKRRRYSVSGKSQYKIDKINYGSTCKFSNTYKLQKLFPGSTSNYTWRKSNVGGTWKQRSLKNNNVWLGSGKEASDARKETKQNRSCNMTLVNIGGILYKTTSNKLTRAQTKRSGSAVQKTPKIKSKGRTHHVVYVRGEKFLLDSRGHTLQRQEDNSGTAIRRVDIGGVTFVQKNKKLLVRTNTHRARLVVNHARQKSIAVLVDSRRKNNQPCLIFSRLGRCLKRDRGLCSFTHDRKNVAVCQKFLRGSCMEANCLLSHEAVLEKMPTCHFFLQGCCFKENCPYLHVKVNKSAAVCRSFLQGFCTLGKMCKKRHVHLCPDFEKVGKCARGMKCPYPHKTRKRRPPPCPPPKEIPEKPSIEDSEPMRYYNEHKRALTEESSSLPKRVKLEWGPAFIPLSGD